MTIPYWQGWRVSERYIEGDSFGTARLEKMEVDEFMQLRALMGAAQSGIRNTMRVGDTAIRLIVDNTLWMSDSRDELLDHIGAIQDARGRVLVHGLGLGCYLNAILAKPEVTHVDVVEINADVLCLITPYFSACCPKCKTPANHATTHSGICDCGGLLEQNPRVTFHLADAYTKKWKAGTRWDYVWHDIWPTICPDDLEKHTKLKRKFQNRCTQQAAWKDQELKRMQRREKRYDYNPFALKGMV